MAEANVYRTGHFDTTGTTTPQQVTTNIKLTTASGAAATVTPTQLTAKVHVDTIKKVNPSAKHAS